MAKVDAHFIRLWCGTHVYPVGKAYGVAFSQLHFDFHLRLRSISRDQGFLGKRMKVHRNISTSVLGCCAKMRMRLRFAKGNFGIQIDFA